jgi:hypothetical protein
VNDNALYYTLSTIAQTLAAAFGVLTEDCSLSSPSRCGLGFIRSPTPCQLTPMARVASPTTLISMI